MLVRFFCKVLGRSEDINTYGYGLKKQEGIIQPSDASECIGITMYAFPSKGSMWTE